MPIRPRFHLRERLSTSDCPTTTSALCVVSFAWWGAPSRHTFIYVLRTRRCNRPHMDIHIYNYLRLYMYAFNIVLTCGHTYVWGGTSHGTQTLPGLNATMGQAGFTCQLSAARVGAPREGRGAGLASPGPLRVATARCRLRLRRWRWLRATGADDHRFETEFSTISALGGGLLWQPPFGTAGPRPDFVTRRRRL